MFSGCFGLQWQRYLELRPHEDPNGSGALVAARMFVWIEGSVHGFALESLATYGAAVDVGWPIMRCLR
jgi:hypothetical protein